MAKEKRKAVKKKLTQKEAVAFQKYLNTLKEEEKKELLGAVDTAANADNKEAAEKAKERVEKYYTIKDEIEEALIEKLDKAELPLGDRATKEKNPWSPNKVLKIIANLPAKKPEEDAGYILAARNIEVGKRKPTTAKQKIDKEKRALQGKQAKSRKALFQHKVSARKATAQAKKKSPPKKTASTK